MASKVAIDIPGVIPMPSENGAGFIVKMYWKWGFPSGSIWAIY